MSIRVGRRTVLGGLATVPMALSSVRAATARVKIGFIPVLGSAQLFVMVGEGWLRDSGLNAEVIRFDSGPVMMQALASGQLDAYVGGVGPIMVARGQGIDVKVVAALAINELAVLARGTFADAMASNDRLLGAVESFTGKAGRKPKFATQPPGSVPDTFLRYWIDQISGVGFDRVEILGIGIDATQQVFLSGAVDAAIVREPALTLIRDREPSAALVATGGQMFPNQPGSVLAVYRPDAPDRVELVETLVRLTVQATELLIHQPKRAAPHILKILAAGILPLDLIERALVSPASRFISNPANIVEPTQRMLDYQVTLGVVKQAVLAAPAFDLDTYRRVTL